MVWFIFLFLIFHTKTSMAEYRVFELEITTYAEEEKAEDGATLFQSAKIKKPLEEIEKKYIISNLDPEQYRGFYIIRPNQRIRYVNTWRCPGRTSNKDYCPNPKVKTEDISAAAPLETK